MDRNIVCHSATINNQMMEYRHFYRTVILWSAAMAVLFQIASCASTKPLEKHGLSDRTIHSIDSVCMLQLNQAHFPGLAIAVVQGEKTTWSKGYGYSNIEKKTPVDPGEDLFRVGSVSKTITAAALARLTQRELIDLDAPIKMYYKECPEDKQNLTLRQLGGHLAGIRHYKGIEFLSNVHYTNVTAPLEVFIHDTLLCEPGTKFNYSTYGWTLISAVMEMAMKKPFLDIIKEEISDPLQINDLKADQKDSTGFQRVMFYEYQDSMLIPSPTVDISNKWAGGGFLCSAEDLGKFGYAVSEPGLIKKSTLDMFTRSQSSSSGEQTNYGIGFRIGIDDNGRKWYGHSGGSVGGTTMLLIYPEEELVIVTLVNLSSAEMDDLAWKIGKIVLRNKE